MQCFILEQTTQKVNYLYPPLIFFNLLSSLFSTAALSQPPPSFTPPGVVARSLQTSTHLLLFTVFICLLRAADFLLSTTLCPDAHLTVCTFIHTRPQEGVYLTTEGLASLKSPAFAYKTTTVKEPEATFPISIVGAKRVFSEQTLDQHFPLLLDLDVCLSTSGQGRGTEEMVDVEDLWGEGGVLGGEAEVEAVDQDDGFRDEVAVSSDCGVEGVGQSVDSHGQNKGPLMGT